MWDLIVSVPDHCLSFFFPVFEHTADQKFLLCCVVLTFRWCHRGLVSNLIKNGYLFVEDG